MFSTGFNEAELELIKEIESTKGFTFKRLFKIITLSHMLSERTA